MRGKKRKEVIEDNGRGKRRGERDERGESERKEKKRKGKRVEIRIKRRTEEGSRLK